MATTKAPLFVLDASGSLAKSIVFSKWKGRTYVRRHSIPSNPKTGLQTGVRAVMKFVTQNYKVLSAANKAEWLAQAAADNITALNAHVRDSIQRVRIGSGIRINLTSAATAPIDAPTALVSTPLIKGMRLSWTEEAANKGEYVQYLYLYLSAGLTLSMANLKVLIPYATKTIDIIGLATGVPIFWKVRSGSNFGELGTASAEDTDTPL